jgi:hypothetical protein
VFRVCVADCGRVLVRIENRTDLFLFDGLLWLRLRGHVCPPFGMKPGTPVFTTGFILCLV